MGTLVPSLEQEDPLRIIDAFENLAMGAPLKRAADAGRLKLYPVDLLRAASARLAGRLRARGSPGPGGLRGLPAGPHRLPQLHRVPRGVPRGQPAPGDVPARRPRRPRSRVRCPLCGVRTDALDAERQDLQRRRQGRAPARGLRLARRLRRAGGETAALDPRTWPRLPAPRRRRSSTVSWIAGSSPTRASSR